jgi:hypothetical protein
MILIASLVLVLSFGVVFTRAGMLTTTSETLLTAPALPFAQ